MASERNKYSKAVNNRGFTGHEHLTWCGLVNMNARLYDPALGRFLSPDPKVQQPEGTQGFNRYTYCLNNPLRYVDLDGENTYIFDSHGKLERIEYNIYTNRIMVHTIETSNGLVWDRFQYYDLADPINDGLQIENKTITHLEFVSESDILEMLKSQDAWDANKGEFLMQSFTGGRFDYSFSVLQYRYKNAAFNGTNSHYLFLPEGDYMAHNFMNFGNYLWAATGYIVGFDISTLQLGAHLNSKMNGERDGTTNDWDSEDDQESIKKGFYHAYKNNYRNK